MKVFFLFFLSLCNFQIYGQSKVTVRNISNVKNLMVYDADSFNYKVDKNVLIIDCYVNEPKNLYVILIAADNRKLKFRVWINEGEHRSLEFSNNMFVSSDSNWYEKNEIIYSNRHRLNYTDEEVKSKIMDYIKNNSNFLSLYYFTHHYNSFSKNEFRDLYSRLKKVESNYIRYPSYKKLEKIAANNFSKSRKCQNTNDSFIDFNYTDVFGKKKNTELVDNKITYLYFSFLGCKACKVSTPYLDSLYQKVENTDINFIAFFMSKDSDSIQSMNYYRKYQWASGSDFEGETSSIIDRYNIQVYPSLLIFKNRKLFKKLDDVEMIRSITDLKSP